MASWSLSTIYHSQQLFSGPDVKVDKKYGKKKVNIKTMQDPYMPTRAQRKMLSKNDAKSPKKKHVWVHARHLNWRLYVLRTLTYSNNTHPITPNRIYPYLPSRLLTAHDLRLHTGLKIMSAEHKLTRTHIRPGRRVIIMISWKKPHTTTHEIFLNSIFKKDPGWARQQEQISPNLERKNKSSPVHHGLITS